MYLREHFRPPDLGSCDHRGHCAPAMISVCVYVCVYMLIYVWVHTYKHIYACMCIYMYVCTYIYIAILSLYTQLLPSSVPGGGAAAVAHRCPSPAEACGRTSAAAGRLVCDSCSVPSQEGKLHFFIAVQSKLSRNTIPISLCSAGARGAQGGCPSCGTRALLQAAPYPNRA